MHYSTLKHLIIYVIFVFYNSWYASDHEVVKLG